MSGRLRLPLPWENSPHGNAYAISAGDGIVLVDTGYAGEDGTQQLEFALAQVGWELDDIRLVVCTHTHADHYGLAGPILDAAGCELWMHPAWDHVRPMVEDPAGTVERRLELARRGGVPEPVLESFRAARAEAGSGVARIVEPDRALRDGDEVKPITARGASSKPRGTPPRTSSFTSPRAACSSRATTSAGRSSCSSTTGTPPIRWVSISPRSSGWRRSTPGCACRAMGARTGRCPARCGSTGRKSSSRSGRVREALGDEPTNPVRGDPELRGRRRARTGHLRLRDADGDVVPRSPGRHAAKPCATTKATSTAGDRLGVTASG